jgi:hypothetical protein
MEEHAVTEHALTERLEHSRGQLRAMLVPDPQTGRIEADVFPRSAVMRFLFDPRRRGMATAGIAALTMLAGRRKRRRVGGWSQMAHLASKFFLAARH